ncbi:MAG: hypothetical protein AAFO94_14865 [Bacteroidota bacterium]
MDRKQKIMAIKILLAFAIFYFVGSSLEPQLGAAAILLSGLLALVVLFVPFGK